VKFRLAAGTKTKVINSFTKVRRKIKQLQKKGHFFDLKTASKRLRRKDRRTSNFKLKTKLFRDEFATLPEPKKRKVSSFSST
jgi:hypothetical protein